MWQGVSTKGQRQREDARQAPKEKENIEGEAVPTKGQRQREDGKEDKDTERRATKKQCIM